MQDVVSLLTSFSSGSQYKPDCYDVLYCMILQYTKGPMPLKYILVAWVLRIKGLGCLSPVPPRGTDT